MPLKIGKVILTPFRILCLIVKGTWNLIGLALVECNDALEHLIWNLSKVNYRRVFRGLCTLRIAQIILRSGVGFFRPRRTFEDFRAVRLAVFFGIAGLLFDSVKAVLWSGWRPPQEYGNSILLIYLGCNVVAVLIAAFVRRFQAPFRWGCLFLGLSLFTSGFLNWMVLEIGIEERALMPLVWHGVCLTALSWWGVLRGLEGLRWVKIRWLHNL